MSMRSSENIEARASDLSERGNDGAGLGEGGEAVPSKAPSFQDDDIFEEYRKILKDRRKRRARREGSAG
jgi:hypothetical protein